jgi:hypothetical protein
LLKTVLKILILPGAGFSPPKEQKSSVPFDK